MASIFVLGPSEWDPTRGGVRQGPSPLERRRALAKLLEGDTHHAFLMEDARAVDGEDILDKFWRLIRERGPAARKCRPRMTS